MESGKVKASELLHRRNTVEEFYSPSVRRIKLLASRSHYPLKPVAQFAHVRGGKRLPPATPYIENHDGSGIPYVRTCDIRPESGAIDLSNVVYIDEATHQIIRNYQLQQNDIVISIAGTIGAVGMLRQPLERCNFNENMAKVRVFDAELLPEYVAAYFDSGFGQAYITWSAGGAVQAKLSLERIEQIFVPVLPLEVQRRVAQVMQDVYQERRKLLQTVDRLQQSFDGYLKSKLNIKEENVIDEPRFRVKISSLRQRHDVEFFQPKNYSLQALLKSLGARPLNEVFTYSSETCDPTKNPLETFDYVGIASIDVHLGSITAPMKIVGEFAPSRARRVIRKGNILVSTVRPTRGAIAIVPPELDGQICSTGFAVLEPKDEVEPLFLHSMLRMNVVRQQFGRFATGASYPAIIKTDMNEVLLPFTEDKNLRREISAEANRRFQEASRKIAEADNLLDKAKCAIEKIILGEDFSLDVSANEHAAFPSFDPIGARIEHK